MPSGGVTPPPTCVGSGTGPVAPVAPVAPVSQAPRLLEEARAAMNAKDLPKAAQLLGEVLKVEPGNAEASTRKAEVDSRMASLAKKFVTGATSVIGGKTAKGPSGFDLGEGPYANVEVAVRVSSGNGRVVGLVTVNDNLSKNPSVFVLQDAGPPAPSIGF